MKKIKKESLFYFFVYINVFCKGIGLENDSKIYLGLLLIGILALGLKYASDKYTKKEFAVIFLMLFLGLINLFITKRTTMFLTCLCLAGMKNIDINKLFKGMLKIRLVTFISLVGLSLSGFINNNAIEMWRINGYVTRYSLGFGHPNTLHLSLFILISLYIYTYYNKIKLKNIIILTLANIFIGIYSKSLTGIIAVTILLLITYISKLNFKIVKRLILSIPKYIYIFLLLFSFATALLYPKLPIISDLNLILNGRIAYSAYYLNRYGFSLLGNNIILDTNAIFDNGYLYLYTQFGIVGLIFISYLLFKIFSNVKKNNDVRKSILLTTYLIYIFTESFSPNIFMNIILFFAGDIIFKKEDIKQNEITNYNKQIENG